MLYNIWNLRKTHVCAEVLSSVTFSIHEGETLGIIGPSGSGKTTLLNILRGLDLDFEGTIQFKGNSLSPGKEYFNQLGSVYQDVQGVLNPQHTVHKIIEEPFYICKKRGAHILELEKLLFEVGLEKRHLLLFPHQLSGGEKQRVCLARALAVNPQILLMDEPLCSLDDHSQRKILSFLKEKKGVTIVMASHDLSSMQQFCDRILVLVEGTIEETLLPPYSKENSSSIEQITAAFLG